METATGKIITERALRRGLRINILAGCCGMAWVSIAGGMPLIMFMESIRATGVQMGLVSTVQQLAMLVQVPSAFVSEMLKSRKLFWSVIALLHRLVWFIPFFLPLVAADNPRVMAYVMVTTVAVSAILAHASTATWYSWMSDLVPERMRNRFWSSRQGVVWVAFLAATALTGYVLDAFPDPRQPGGSFTGFVILFFVAGVLGISDILIHLAVPEPAPQPILWNRRFLQRIIAPLRNSDFRTLTVSMGFWSFAVGLVGQFSFLCLKRHYGATYMHLSWLSISSAAGIILSSFLWAYFMDRLGARNFGVIMMILAPLFGLAWFFLPVRMVEWSIFGWGSLTMPYAISLLVIVNCVAGSFYAGVGLSQISLLGALSPREGRTMAMAVHWAVVGLMAALGPVVGGAIMDAFEARPFSARLPMGTPLNFFHFAIALQCGITWLIAVPLLLKVRLRSGEMAFRTALSRFANINPIRMVSSIYNIYSISSADSRGEQVSALRKLGKDRTAIAVADLIARLDDPSLEVREEAVLALGQIGSPDALDALVAQLEAPEADLVPEIARALRASPSNRGVNHLIRHLKTADRQTRVEIARTLGEIGDRRAAPALLDLMRETNDAKITAVCAEALARLGEFSAVYEMVPRMWSVTHPGLTRSLTVSLGDLLGEPGGFYRLMTHEARNPGSETEAMIDRLIAHLNRAERQARDPRPWREMIERVRRLDSELSEGRKAEAGETLYEIGLRLAALDFHLDSRVDPDSLLESLVMRDQRRGVGLWFLGILRTQAGRNPAAAVDNTELLLGLYFLSEWVRRHPPG